MPEVIGTYTGSRVGITATTVTVDLPSVPAAGDVIVAIVTANGTNETSHTLSGLGATWTLVVRDSDYHVFDVWVGHGATSGGTATATRSGTSSATDATTSKILNLWHLRGTTGAITGIAENGVTSGTMRGPVMSAGSGQIVLGAGYSDTATGAYQNPLPSAGWSSGVIDIHAGDRFASLVHRVPTDTADHSFEVYRATSSAHPIVQMVVGDLGATPKTLASAFETETSLSTTFSNYRNLSTGYSTETSLTTQFLGLAKLDSAYSTESSLSTELSYARRLASSFDTETSLSTSLTVGAPVESAVTSQFSVETTLFTRLKRSPRLTSKYSTESVLTTALEFLTYPQPVKDKPLGKLTSYNVRTSSVPLNPDGGTGATPSVSAGFTKGRDPEFAMGTDLELANDRLGSYAGEIVTVNVASKSDRVSVTADTLMTLLNTDVRAFPFIDAASTWTAARAVDYWTQQARIFYDRVPGEAVMYASGFGHTLGYVRGLESKRVAETGGTAETQIRSGRSVRTFGDPETISTMQTPGASVNISARERLIFSAGFGLEGFGQVGEVHWNFSDDNGTYRVRLTAASAGQVAAYVGSQFIGVFSVPQSAAYRATLSLERHSANTVSGKLTVHTDDLAGNGVLLHNGPLTVFASDLPATLNLDNVQYTTSGSDDRMFHYGTYLSVAQAHPMELPAVQKDLAQGARNTSYVSGFAGNLWDNINEYCSIKRLDLGFEAGRLKLSRRLSGMTQGISLSGFSVNSQRREKYKKVAVMNRGSKATTAKDNVIWRADSVYQVNTREIFETTIQTEHSLLELSQPSPAKEILPFPYEKGFGQYVVTGADGYIVSPKFWNDIGGKITVELTDNEGEFLLKIKGPDVHHETRSPYRISEGAADRPALYISGSGIINKPEQIEINTGATQAREGFDSVFESPFVGDLDTVYSVAFEKAKEYSSAAADCSLNEPGDFDKPSKFGQNAAGKLFSDNERNYYITSADLTHSSLSMSAVPHTTLRAYKDSFPAGSTIKDEKERNRGLKIKHFNIKPLRGK